MDVIIKCPKCGSDLSVDSTDTGKFGNCPSCEHSFYFDLQGTKRDHILGTRAPQVSKAPQRNYDRYQTWVAIIFCLVIGAVVFMAFTDVEFSKKLADPWGMKQWVLNHF